MQPITRYLQLISVIISSEYLSRFYDDYPIKPLDNVLLEHAGDVNKTYPDVMMRCSDGMHDNIL